MSTQDEDDDLESPSLESPPTSPDSDIPSPLESPPATQSPSQSAPTISPRNSTSAATTSNMTSSSTPLGTLNAARGRPAPMTAASSSSTTTTRGGATQMNPEIMAKMRAFNLSRQNMPSQPKVQTLGVGGGAGGGPILAGAGGPQTPGAAPGGFPAGFKLPPSMQRPGSTSAVPGARPSGMAGTGGAAGVGPGKGMSLAEKRGLKLPGGLPPVQQASAPSAPAGPSGRKPKPSMTLSSMGGGQANGMPAQDTAPKPKEQSQMDKYAEFIDTATGALRFKGKAVVHGSGIDFTSGRSFSISLDEVDTLDELGKGNYGTVYKVRHSRPKFRRTGQGLAGNKARGITADDNSPSSPKSAGVDARGTTGLVMAMKEIRLELDDAKFAAIIMELDILHRCTSLYIVDFYGAFFQEGAVYICMEFMDGGSVDKIYGDGVPENVLRKITLNTTLGLKSLKEDHNIIHRDVKPTNILVNTRGQIKICDFGVSGNLVASIARTNIGCQSYMAPERISSGGMAQAGAASSGGSYSVQSDIWSLGLTIIECALGRYPYPPETYDNIFSQLSAIVDGAPPDLPAETFSEASRDFVAGCLNKIPNLRPTYPMLLQHPWLATVAKPSTIVEEDEEAAEQGEAQAEIPIGIDAGADATEGSFPVPEGGFVDREVGMWVLEALDKRKRGALARKAKPALHAAPLDAVGSPMDGKKVVAVDA